MADSTMGEIGRFAGLPLDLPPGQHPFDPYLGAPYESPLVRFDPKVKTVRAHPDYL